MQAMKFFMDTHDRDNGSFPADLDAAQFQAFFVQYEAACRQEGVTLLRVHLGLGAGRAFCFTMAPDAEAVRRAHERVGLPFDDITEVSSASPADLQFHLA